MRRRPGGRSALSSLPLPYQFRQLTVHASMHMCECVLSIGLRYLGISDVSLLSSFIGEGGGIFTFVTRGVRISLRDGFMRRVWFSAVCMCVCVFMTGCKKVIFREFGEYYGANVRRNAREVFRAAHRASDLNYIGF